MRAADSQGPGTAPAEQEADGKPIPGERKRADRPEEARRRTSILVTDGDQRSALAAVRALGRSGYSVTTCSTRERSLAGSSRFSHRSWRVSAPLTRPQAYAEDVARIVTRADVDVVLPVTEPSLLALLPEREHLAPAVVPFAEYGTLQKLLDKAEVLRRAPDHGIAVPRQVILPNRRSARRSSIGEARFPVVVKPARSVGTRQGVRRSVGVTHVSEPSEFVPAVRGLSSASFPLLVQERITGPGVGIFLLLDEEGVVARFAHRRLREKPPSGGVSVLRESVRPDDALFAKARSLLEDFGWEGVAMVEFKVRAETGEPYLMEVNPRLWGSLQLAIDAGVDFPTLLVRSALGETVPRRLNYQAGIRTRWLWGDVDHLLARIRSAVESDGGLAQRAGILSEAIGAFASDWGTGTNLEVVDWSDPRPFLRESLDWCSEAVRDGGGEG